MTSPFPNKDSGKFRIIIPFFLNDKEIDYYYNKANEIYNEDVYFSEGLYRGYFTDKEFADKLK